MKDKSNDKVNNEAIDNDKVNNEGIDNDSSKPEKEKGMRMELIMDYSQQFPFLRPKKSWEK